MKAKENLKAKWGSNSNLAKALKKRNESQRARVRGSNGSGSRGGR
jgi:hypothetical protein